MTKTEFLLNFLHNAEIILVYEALQWARKNLRITLKKKNPQ